LLLRDLRRGVMVLGGLEEEPSNRSDLVLLHNVEDSAGCSRFINSWKAAKARLLDRWVRRGVPGKSGETVQRARMVAGCLGLQSVGMCQNNMAKPGWWAMTGDWEGGGR
jgi:hypothetical protein